MHMHTRGRHTNYMPVYTHGDKTQQNSQLLGPFLFLTLLYWLANLLT